MDNAAVIAEPNEEAQPPSRPDSGRVPPSPSWEDIADYEWYAGI
ncbi:MAG TPA: hypothetical protein VJP82_07820 [Sphingomicrobium sp.]|jgi:hypothetical protein|nr:hypothetical protein [Sphingomicrobium sp.]HKU93238.1 hypothetical protein [Sphingomicrobium sp.]